MSTDAKNDLKLDDLKRLRDELRVQAHLGGLEAKDAWAEVEPHFDTLMNEAARAGKATAKAMGGALQELKHFVAAVQQERRIQHDKREGRG